MCVADIVRVNLDSYKFKSIARIWFDQWKKNTKEGAPLLCWAMFEDAFLGCFFLRELRMSLPMFGLSHLSNKESNTTMLIGDMDIARLMIHVQQIGLLAKELLEEQEEVQNCLCAMTRRHDYENSPDVVPNMLKIFTLDDYA
ncbi:hypothetical protein MTR67_052037 [Solanum verrucosum]|uniref:Uncharacterized protein n=1 Tax=Solanum verrucosum TaxID=315347 RepID=A0AAF0ZZL6_SOLVR|nr:hypothetical protein MTR67_052037 [Solanum verrucosum]